MPWPVQKHNAGVNVRRFGIDARKRPVFECKPRTFDVLRWTLDQVVADD